MRQARSFHFLYLCSIALVGFFIFSFPRPSHAAFGISPPFINTDHLTKGAKYSQVVYLVQDQPDQDLHIRAVLTIPDEVKSWISIDKGNDFIIPQGVRQFPVTVTITVPQDAGLGSYHGNIAFTTMPSKNGQVTIALGVQTALNFVVGTGVYENLSVPIIKSLDIEEGWAPKALIKIANDGNVSEQISMARFEIYDQFNAVRLVFAQKTSDLPTLPPFTINEYTIEFPIDLHLGIGQYWGNVSVYQNDKLLASQKTIFNVLKSGSISGTISVLTNHFRTWGNFYVAGVAIVIAIGGTLVVRRRRKTRSA